MAPVSIMGFFDWLMRILGGAPPPRRPVIVRPEKRVYSAFAPQRKPGAPPPAPKPKRPVASYDAAQEFMPISRKELLKGARATASQWTEWRWRTDAIPPSTDARTKLLDRALVTHGFLTPEQLAEAHHYGDLMLLRKGDKAALRAEAEKAVERSKEERERIKAEKKRQAAERKRKHAEEVAARKASDIVFLGRGVSGGLADRNSDAAKLEKAGLPVLSTPADIARALGIEIPPLRWLAFHSDAATSSHYVRFQIPKKSGGVREISSPQPKLAAAQRWILMNVLSKVPVEPCAHGFVPGRSTVTNAAPHVKRAVVVNLDLKNFFPTVTFPRARGVFQRMGYSPAVATVFALLATEAPRQEVDYDGKKYFVAVGPRALPQGACTSPAISNLVTRKLDRRLTGLARKLGWTYTRYADDLTFSGDTLVPKGDKDARSVAWLMARVRHIVDDERFVVNESKVRVLRRNAAQEVTGVVVNEKVSTGREERRRLRAILHRARFEGLEKQNRSGHPNFTGWLQGHVAYVSMVNADQGRPLRTKLDALLKRG